jgi:hypothetical protein
VKAGSSRSPATSFSNLDAQPFPARRPSVSKDVFDLPPRRTADELVESYIFYVHTLYPFLHEPTFRSQYEALWGPPGQKDDDIVFMAILNLVFALGCRFLSKSARDSETMALEGQRFLKRAKALLRDDILNTRSLASVQALLLLGQYVCLYFLCQMCCGEEKEQLSDEWRTGPKHEPTQLVSLLYPDVMICLLTPADLVAGMWWAYLCGWLKALGYTLRCRTGHRLLNGKEK